MHDTCDGTPESLANGATGNHADRIIRQQSASKQPASTLSKQPFLHGQRNLQDKVTVSKDAGELLTLAEIHEANVTSGSRC